MSTEKSKRLKSSNSRPADILVVETNNVLKIERGDHFAKKRKSTNNEINKTAKKAKQSKDESQLKNLTKPDLAITSNVVKKDLSRASKRKSQVDIGDAKAKVKKASRPETDKDSVKVSQKDSVNKIKCNKVTEKKNKNVNNSKIKELIANDKSSQPTSNKKQKLPNKAIKKSKGAVKSYSVLSSSPKKSTEKPVGLDDPMAMLMMMEGKHELNFNSKPVTIFKSSKPGSSSYETMEDSNESEKSSSAASSEEELSEWEEVQNHSIPGENELLPNKTVEITLEIPNILKHKKRKNKTFDWKLYLNRRVKRFKKDIAMNMHKVHLLCLLSFGLKQNQILNEPTILALMLSLLPPQLTKQSKASVELYVANLHSWYKKKFPLENVNHCSDMKLVKVSNLLSCLSENIISDARLWVLIFIALLRSVGLTVKLVLSFQPMPFKVTEDGAKGEKAEKKQVPVKKQKKTKGKKEPIEKHLSSKKSSITKKTASESRRLSFRESGKKAAAKNKKDIDELNKDSSYEEYSENDDQKVKSKEQKQSKNTAKRKTIERGKNEAYEDSSSEKEFEESSFSFPSSLNLKKDLKILSNRKILSPSTSDDDNVKPKPQGHDFWLEIYFPQKKRWICFDCFKCQFDKPHSLESSATQPLSYVLGFKIDNSVKDVTARYASNWLSFTRKIRTDEIWWSETMLTFDQTPHQDNLLEDDDIKSHLLVRPMPQTISEFKSHPLYALQRHLLKFEAIYPETAIPLGYIRNEPIYARECVRVLHSRDNWLKEGRLVRLNEKPYKMVKSRPKWNKPKENPDALDLELFGEWQTELYMAPPAFEGKVPRNDYGNVELFKPWMLPKGTVHIRGQGMQRVAKKLNIDVAPAMVGWDHHCGCSVPLMDGWVVCEEYADSLMTAWLEDQEIQKQREEEALEKRVYGNWRRLIRGLLIKERLKKKFLQTDQLALITEKEETFSDGEVACDVQQSWPCNRQQNEASKKSKTEVKPALLKHNSPPSIENETVDTNLADTKIMLPDNQIENIQTTASNILQSKRKANVKLNKMKMNAKKVKTEETSSDESEEETDQKVKGKGIIVSQKNKVIKAKTEVKKGRPSNNKSLNKINSRIAQSKRKTVEDDASSEHEFADETVKLATPRRLSIARAAKSNIQFVYKSNSESSNTDQEEEEN